MDELSMIDWLTLWADATSLPAESLNALLATQDRITRITPDGVIKWETTAHDSVRSDSHQITIRLGSRFCIQGSPARVMGGNNVFGSGDIRECAWDMIDFVARERNIVLPPLDIWSVTRVDVTHNYALDSPSMVRQALAELGLADGGRYQKRTMAETIYWSPNSAVRSGKAYAKGPHLRMQLKKGQASATSEQLALADCMLRLELSLRNQFWRREATKSWLEYSEGDFDRLHAAYFRPLVGSVELVEMDKLLDICIKTAVGMRRSEAQGKAAYRYWLLVKAIGLQEARALTPKSSHYHHMKVLIEAGLGYADFQARNVVVFRRKQIALDMPVRTWNDVRKAG
ncbi:MAG: phage/plasmid replication protein, II/X family [Gammaproteobacteria bacterium]